MKPSPKEMDTAEQMRQSIVSGRWACGEKLPPYSKLEKMFPVSRVTLHRAVARLQREGFLNGFERKGVFVSEKPPHLNRIALLLPSPTDRNHFAEILANDALSIARQKGYEMIVLTHLNRAYYHVDEVENLHNELLCRRFAGMIVSLDPAGCPIPSIFDTDIPKVYMSSFGGRKGFKIGLDNQALVFNAMKWLKTNGVKKVAVIAYGDDNPILDYAKATLGEFGFETRPEWMLGIGNETLSGHVARLMFASGVKQRPDGLFIADDNFTEDVTRGIMANRIKVPDELKIISHCNWSMPPKRLAGMELIGFNSRKIISEGIRMIEEFHKGNNAFSSIMLPPLLESETTI